MGVAFLFSHTCSNFVYMYIDTCSCSDLFRVLYHAWRWRHHCVPTWPAHLACSPRVPTSHAHLACPPRNVRVVLAGAAACTRWAALRYSTNDGRSCPPQYRLPWALRPAPTVTPSSECKTLSSTRLLRARIAPVWTSGRPPSRALCMRTTGQPRYSLLSVITTNVVVWRHSERALQRHRLHMIQQTRGTYTINSWDVRHSAARWERAHALTREERVDTFSRTPLSLALSHERLLDAKWYL